MKNILKQDKGVAGTDALIAILIISLFTGLIATILYNIYLANTSLKRMTTANTYLIDILEYTDKLYYDELDTNTKLIQKYSYLSNVQDVGIPEDEDLDRMWKLQGTIDNGYNVEITQDMYKPEETTLDLVRKITVNISYKVGNKNQNIEVYKTKSREKLRTPNKPDLSLMQVQENETLYAVKQVNENYVVCTQNDINWYNYSIENPTDSISAKAIASQDSLNVGDIISEDEYDIFQWVPRYVEDENQDIVFLYSNTNKYVQTNSEGYNVLEDSNLDATQMFQNNTGFWQQV